jgi:hypothetical protein
VKLFLSLLVLLSGPGAIVVGQQTSQDSSAASWQYRFSGYYKSLLTASRSFFTRDSYGDSLNRLRLSFDARRGRWFQTHIDFDNEAHFGNRIRLPDFELVRGRQDTAYVDLQHVYADKRHVYWDTSLYRAFVNLRHESAALTVGRQRIGWGTARFWSPADVFNPSESSTNRVAGKGGRGRRATGIDPAKGKRLDARLRAAGWIQAF